VGYIVRVSFSQERMTSISSNDSADGTAKVIYESKDGKTSETCGALNPASVTYRGEQMVYRNCETLNYRYFAFKTAGSYQLISSIIP